MQHEPVLKFTDAVRLTLVFHSETEYSETSYCVPTTYCFHPEAPQELHYRALSKPEDNPVYYSPSSSIFWKDEGQHGHYLSIIVRCYHTWVPGAITPLQYLISQ